jgi:hypothetical protein
MNYFVSPAAKTDLIIDPTQLATHLKSQWREVEIHPIENPQRAYSLEWIIPMESRNLEGALEKTGQAVILDGDVSDCARFSLWLRSLIDPKYPLFFYDEGYSADIELHQKTTQEQIVNLFASQVGTTELEVRSS